MGYCGHYQEEVNGRGCPVVFLQGHLLVGCDERLPTEKVTVDHSKQDYKKVTLVVVVLGSGVLQCLNSHMFAIDGPSNNDNSSALEICLSIWCAWVCIV